MMSSCHGNAGFRGRSRAALVLGRLRDLKGSPRLLKGPFKYECEAGAQKRCDRVAVSLVLLTFTSNQLILTV